MVMPLCGTFRYAGVVPADGLRSGPWMLQDASAASATRRGDALFDNRLIGLQPTLEISNGQLVLKASSRDRAQISPASLQVDPALIELFRTGDVLHLARTGTADIGVSVVRGLVVARVCVHETVVYSAERLITPNAGLVMTDWPTGR